MLNVPIKLMRTAIVAAIKSSRAICIFFIIFFGQLPGGKGNGEMADNLTVLTKSLEWQMPMKLQSGVPLGRMNGEW